MANPPGIVGSVLKNPFCKQFFSKVTEGVQKGLHFPEKCPWAVWLGYILPTRKFDTILHIQKKFHICNFHIINLFFSAEREPRRNGDERDARPDVQESIIIFFIPFGGGFVVVPYENGKAR